MIQRNVETNRDGNTRGWRIYKYALAVHAPVSGRTFGKEGRPHGRRRCCSANDYHETRTRRMKRRRECERRIGPDLFQPRKYKVNQPPLQCSGTNLVARLPSSPYPLLRQQKRHSVFSVRCRHRHLSFSPFFYSSVSFSPLLFFSSSTGFVYAQPSTFLHRAPIFFIGLPV